MSKRKLRKYDFNEKKMEKSTHKTALKIYREEKRNARAEEKKAYRNGYNERNSRESRKRSRLRLGSKEGEPCRESEDDDTKKKLTN